MSDVQQITNDYREQLDQWQKQQDADLRRPDGWLTLVGLGWLHEGDNTLGSAPDNETVLPASAPAHVGIIHLNNGQASFTATAMEPITVDGVPTQHADLRNDHDPKGPSLIQVGTVTVHVIKRETEYALRIRDSQSETRLQFQGRQWFPIDEKYHLQGKFNEHPTARQIEVENSIGKRAIMSNPGYVDFVIDGTPVQLQAFSASENDIWFVFRDATSGKSTYGAGRFVYATLNEDKTVDIDFNRAYHPPCAFTHFATCPFPPKENILSIEIPVGEKN